jgi:acyl-coenzyme A synthetase/AMP-(fatty) acid ligase
MNTLPLLPLAGAGRIVARRDGRAVSREEFLWQVSQLAQRLPQVERAINLCADRYWFAVSFFACVQRGIVSLLPNSAAPEHLAAVCAHSDGLLAIGEDPESKLPHVPYLRVEPEEERWPAGEAAELAVPLIPEDRLVARVFTSGSTGVPQAYDKFFGCLQHSVAAAARRVWEVTGSPCAVVGTSSFRHMYGFESTVLLPLLAGGELSSKVPYFPADVSSALSEFPEPRLLVTTPFHLRNLLEAGVALPKIAAVLSATAPLSRELACQAQAQLQAPVFEIYGATETGQLATRISTEQTQWWLMDGIELAQTGETTIAHGRSLHRPQALNDVIELVSATHFRLIDRGANLVNIAGKKTTLSVLNLLLSQVPGVSDGVFCLPEHTEGQGQGRLTAFVVAPRTDAASILNALRSHVDPVFLPRPIVFVDELPRDSNGKVTALTLRRLREQHGVA